METDVIFKLKFDGNLKLDLRLKILDSKLN